MKPDLSTCGSRQIGFVSDCNRFASSREDIVKRFEETCPPFGQVSRCEFNLWKRSGDFRDPWGSWK